MSLARELIKIPHLRIGGVYDVEIMLDEIHDVIAYVPYFNYFRKEPTYQGEWEIRGLYNFTGNSLNTRNGSSLDVRAKLQPTELIEKMPYINSIIQKLGATISVTNLSKIYTGKKVPWHNHYLQNKQPINLLTCHLSIISPIECRYNVAGGSQITRVGRGYQLQSNGVMWSTRHEPGTINIFNSYHWHSVFNDGPEDKISVMMLVSLDHPAVKRAIERSLASYTGPVIEEEYDGL